MFKYKIKELSKKLLTVTDAEIAKAAGISERSLNRYKSLKIGEKLEMRDQPLLKLSRFFSEKLQEKITMEDLINEPINHL